MEAGGGVCKGAARRVLAKRGAADLTPDRFTLRRLARAGFVTAFARMRQPGNGQNFLSG